ncbi:MAG: hypothetical protein H8D56_24145 [Planctomycetes bacterium]|nr:hypothetical protein [Planctomycetota bacterium]
MASSKRFLVCDRYDNEIYLTHERWEHIIEKTNHPEMIDCEEQLKQTIHSGKRKQDALNPQKYRYIKAFDGLAGDNTHIVVIVLFRFIEDGMGNLVPNNYIVTAYQKERG